MANPIIILGAGASKDYSVDVNPAPLTNELVEAIFLDNALFNKYPGAAELFSDVRRPVLSKTSTFEKTLRDIKESVGTQPRRIEQFIALEFYLRDRFSAVSKASQPTNNYKALINRIHDFNAGKACVVSFNYDSLFEQSLRKAPASISDYICNDIKIIKLHGSHDWTQIYKPDLPIHFQSDASQIDYNFYVRNPDILQKLRSKGASPYHIAEIDKISNHQKENLVSLPVIAVPLFNKEGSFLAPQDHIDKLINEIQKADRILIIGWSAGDTDLLRLLEQHLSKRVPALVVSRDAKSSIEICTRIENKYKKLNCTHVNGGFSDFVTSDICSDFLVSVYQ